MLQRLIRVFLPALNRAPASAAPAPVEATPQQTDTAYQEKIRNELRNFKEVTDVHALPKIYDYWAQKYILPMFRDCGFADVDEFYRKYFLEAARRTAQAPPRFISIGAGNCDTEIRIAQQLRDAGLASFTFECVELNPDMLARGRQLAAEADLERQFIFTEVDFNAWSPAGQYAAVMANHSLHHVVNLEGLFGAIKSSLHPSGYFLTNDMIGRNGHQRWPEALKHVNAIWPELPESYQYNQLLKRQEPTFINWDCSGEGFEGIRAQDILPLLIDRFEFAVYVGFAAVISPFVDRCFGHNFDPTSPRDMALIDRIHEIDEAGFKSGELKPTQMLAVMTPTKCDAPVYARGLSPEQSIRHPS